MKVSELKRCLDKVDDDLDVMVCKYDEIADFAFGEIGLALLVEELSIISKGAKLILTVADY